MVKFFVLLSSLTLNLGFAHEGHDEPKTMPAPKGGVTRMNENYFFEYVYQADGGSVYLYTHDSKPAEVSQISAKAYFEIPRKPKVDAKVTLKGNSWKIDAKLPKSHRITLKLSVQDKGHADMLTFVVEPK